VALFPKKSATAKLFPGESNRGFCSNHKALHGKVELLCRAF